jgi:hypothetical protein
MASPLLANCVTSDCTFSAGTSPHCAHTVIAFINFNINNLSRNKSFLAYENKKIFIFAF